MITKITQETLHLFEEIYHKRTSKDLVNTSLDNNNLSIYVIHDELVYGWISIVFIPKVGYRDGCYFLDELYVDPEYENNGYASALLRFINEEFKDEEIRLVVEVDNENAVHLYQKHGFSIVNKAYYMKREKQK